ncbi:MAG: LysM peptidoglycan-binding domain-containing M23 family metallopeptidase [Alphaproteobacteria bacterium]|nr:LysM peptidoglycan-binding domain-containing M23 family metallopeptidase [Alphaproteobacteria bacterium]
MTNTNSTQTTPPIVDPLPPAKSASALSGDRYNRSVSGSNLVGSALPQGSVADGSGVVTVNRGDTLYSIARANNVHVKDLIASNGLQAPYHLSAGQRISLPRDTNGRTRVASNSAYSPQPTYAEPRQSLSSGGTHRVKAGETLYSLGRTYNVHPKQIASLNQLNAPYGLNVGQTVRIPGGDSASAFPSSAGSTARVGQQTAERQVAQPNPAKTARVETRDINSSKSDRRVEKKQAERVKPLPQPEQRASSRFRWPLKGRVISSFGPKPSGSRNDGINIAVPEGTNVLSAENGVVAYAGNELKGYGNLVLIRHDGGWVTAYAHNKELFVKRGDRVTRGKVIAKAGSTGSVNSPQLHFEIRKGADAVNPMKYLGRSKVAGG